MDSEVDKAAKEINDAIFVMQKLGKKQPNEFIQNLVSQWYQDSGNEQHVENIISYIDDAKCQRIALQYLHLLHSNQQRTNNALLTQKGHDVVAGLFLGLVVGGFFPILGYLHINLDAGAVHSAEQESKENRQRPYANIGVTISSILWGSVFYFGLI